MSGVHRSRGGATGHPMVKSVQLISASLASFGLLLSTQAIAQTSPRPGASIRDPYITSTGETVDKPGQSQSAGTTKLDRKIQRENNRIDRSICKGC